MEEEQQQGRGFGRGRGAPAEELAVMQQERRRRQAQEEEEKRRRQMFGVVGGVGFPAAVTLGHHQQQAAGCGELAGGFYESEAGGSSEPEPHAPDRPRGGAGSKRTRAAEVHNLSEKMRRSRINEKMKALQSLIPNSNKTDKASMLDEAIEYLKQLQLQVQILSMRNGVYLNPSYLPGGALEPAQASQMFAELGIGGRNVTAPNSGGVVATPVNQSSGAHHSFDTMNSSPQDQPPPLVLPSCPGGTIVQVPAFHLEPSQPHLRSFQLHESSEVIFRGETVPKHHLTSTQEISNLAGNNMNSIRQEPPMLNTDHLDGCSRSKEQSRDMVPTNTRHA